MKYGAIGVIEVSYYTNAVVILDAMEKASDVCLVACYKTLGGKMVHMLVAGTTSQVNAAIEAAHETEQKSLEKGCLKVALTISNPHPEILRFLNV